MGLDIDRKFYPVTCDRCHRPRRGDSRRESIALAWRDGWHLQQVTIRTPQGTLENGSLVLCPNCAEEVATLRSLDATVAE